VLQFALLLVGFGGQTGFRFLRHPIQICRRALLNMANAGSMTETLPTATSLIKQNAQNECCPYTEKLGGVSLFDFNGFDPEIYSQEYRLSSWQFFVPYRDDWGSSVWIEIDRERVAPQLISGPDLVRNTKRQEEI
jgi:hypothetical protein